MNLLKIASLAATVGLVVSSVACQKSQNAHGDQVSVAGPVKETKPSGISEITSETGCAAANGIWNISDNSGNVQGQVEIRTQLDGSQTLSENRGGIVRKIDGLTHSDVDVTYTASCKNGNVHFDFSDGKTEVKRDFSFVSKGSVSGDGTLRESRKTKAQSTFTPATTFRLDFVFISVM